MALTDPEEYKKRKGLGGASSPAATSASRLTSPADYLSRTKEATAKQPPITIQTPATAFNAPGREISLPQAQSEAFTRFNDKIAAGTAFGQPKDTSPATTEPVEPAERPKAYLTSRPADAYSLDDVINAGRGDKAAKQRLGGTAWEKMTPDQRRVLQPKIDDRRKELEEIAFQNSKVSQLPVIGDIQKGIHRLGKVTEPATPYLLGAHTPGGGPAEAAVLLRGAGSLVSLALPSLGKTVGGRIAQTLAAEGITGVPLGISNQLARDPESTPQEIAGAAAGGAASGAVTGGIVRGASEAFPFARRIAADITGNAAQAIERANNLPQYSGALKLDNKAQNVSRIMENIRPAVNEALTPPLENPRELRKWLKPFLGVSNRELEQLSYDDMTELAREVTRSKGVYDTAVDVARSRGVDLPAAFERPPSIRAQVPQDATKRAYGIYPEQLPTAQRPIMSRPPSRPSTVRQTSSEPQFRPELLPT